MRLLGVTLVGVVAAGVCAFGAAPMPNTGAPTGPSMAIALLCVTFGAAVVCAACTGPGATRSMRYRSRPH